MPIQAIVQPSIEAVDFIDTPIPTPKPHEVVIKVVTAASNPKDWKLTIWQNLPHNSGDDLAGTVHSVGASVQDFKPGDRVFAYHKPLAENGAYAEYAVAPAYATAHLPESVSFEEGATVPTGAFTAAVGLFISLGIPAPFLLSSEAAPTGKKPILIYGVTTAVGSFAAKFARLAGLGPVIGVAGNAGAFAKGIVDHVVDYREGEDAVVASVEAFLEKEGLGKKVPVVFDAISSGGSFEATARFIDSQGKVTTTMPPAMFAREKEAFSYPEGVAFTWTQASVIFNQYTDFAYVFSRYIGRLLADGRLKGHPFEILPGGLKSVVAGLQNLQSGKASAVKYVYRIEETGKVDLGLFEAKKA